MATSTIPPEALQQMLAHPNQTYRPQLIAATCICCTASFLAVMLRFTARKVGRIGYGWDDLLIVISLVFAYAYSILMAGMTRIGLGLHVIYLKPEWAHPLGAGGIAALTILPLATYTVKASILLLLGRIFSTQKFKTILWIFFTIFTAFCLASFFAELLQCWPIGSQLTGKAKRCINWDALFTSLSFINAFFDTILLALPLPMIWKLHTNVRRKVQTSAIFLVGLIAVTASFIRAGYSLKSSKVDVSYADAFVALWATVEVNTSIVSACMPNYGPLVMKVLDRKRLSGKRGSYAYDSGDKYSYQKWPSSVNKSDTKITAAGSLHAPSEDVEMGAYRNLSLDEHERLRSATRHQ